MNQPVSSNQTLFGFISILEIEGVGYCGGYLIVSQFGRPIEFHCSAPVSINRAQQILYGKTYWNYLFCEQIGMALIEKAKKSPDILIANSHQLAPLAIMNDQPLVVLTHSAANDRLDERLPGTSLNIGDQQVWYQLPTDQQHRPQQYQHLVKSLLESFSNSLTLDEPFERIEKAIEEAQAVAR